MDPSSTFEHELAGASSKDDALQLILGEVERRMAKLKLATDATSKANESKQVKTLLSRAERIKQSGQWHTQPVCKRPLTKAEQIVLLKASYINGSKYPPWQATPLAAEFELDTEGKPFIDPTVFRLSESQKQSLSGWKPAREALPPPFWPARSSLPAAGEPVQVSTMDIVQDAATDCSVVASLCAVLPRQFKGRQPLLRNFFYPWDHDRNIPVFSTNGKYVAKFNINGTFRRVEIDDTLPVSQTERIIHVFDRNNPAMIWPAILEKMYLKIFGGYDFEGSNSGTDIWIMFGWIPEQIFFGNQDTSLTEIWRRITAGWEQGNVAITLGTGKMSKAAERHIGLASEHSYAVVDLREEQGQPLLLVKNPWFDDPSWKNIRPSQSPPRPGSSGETVSSPRDLLNADARLSPGTFWMDLYNISQHFTSMYLNWDPRLFRYREDIHFAWELDNFKSKGTFIDAPQFVFKSSTGTTAWFLLTRHIQAERLDRDQAQSDEFISISVFDNNATRVILKEQPHDSSPFVDSFQTLLQASDLCPNTAYTVVPNHDGLPDPRHTFTLSVFCNSSFDISRLNQSPAYSTSISGAWTEDTAGGNADSPTFSQNPQYSITIAQPMAVSVLLETADSAIPVNVKLCVGNGGRVRNLRTRDIIADSHTYRPRCALVNNRKLDPGVYTIVCSTFESGQQGGFKLRVDSEHEVTIRRLSQEGAGRLRTSIIPASFAGEEQAQAVLLLPQRLTKFFCIVKYQSQQDSAARQERSMIRVSIVRGGSYQYQVLTTSSDGDYRDALGGIRTNEIDLSPTMAVDSDIWLLVERSVSAKDSDEETFLVDFYTESKDAVQTGDWQEWES